MLPIYYLMPPFYYLVPIPATPQVLQAAILASSVIPLWKIGKINDFPDWHRMLLCVVLLLFPAFSGGVSYDIHENCFLTPLILWLFYGIDHQNLWLTAAAALLTLKVRKDAAVYVAVIAFWLIIRSGLHHNPKMLLGLPLLTIRYERYILLIPYIPVNFMSDYRYSDYYENIRSVFSQITEDTSVSASTFCTTQLSQREILVQWQILLFRAPFELPVCSCK